MTEFISIKSQPKETKKTVFEHFARGDEWVEAFNTPKDYDKVIHLGFSELQSKDLFAAYDGPNPIIYKGIKGSEFD